MGFPFGDGRYGKGLYSRRPDWWRDKGCAGETWAPAACAPPVWSPEVPVPPVWVTPARPGVRVRYGR